MGSKREWHWKYSIPKRRDSETAFIPDFLAKPMTVVQVEFFLKSILPF